MRLRYSSSRPMSRTILKSTSVVGATTLVSRITGLFRDVALAQAFGASALQDAFLVAYKIPNFLRRTGAEGLGQGHVAEQPRDAGDPRGGTGDAGAVEDGAGHGAGGTIPAAGWPRESHGGEYAG